MSIALELFSIRKRFVVGAGSCLASAEVLRGVDLVVRTGEAVAIVGPGGVGKSTLLLCASGLLTPDAGELRWFGDASRACAARRVLYHSTAVDLIRCGRIDEPHVHLVDAVGFAAGIDSMSAWIAGRRERGDAIVLATRDNNLAIGLATRVLALRGGRLSAASSSHARVAEPIP